MNPDQSLREMLNSSNSLAQIPSQQHSPPSHSPIFEYQRPQKMDEELNQAEMNQENSSDEDYHNNQCFKCQQNGQLVCCSNCQKAFHFSCITQENIEKVEKWACQFCCYQIKKVCRYCEQPIQHSEKDKNGMEAESEGKKDEENPNFIPRCTICYCQFHQECVKIPPKILFSENYFFQGAENFVCRICLFIHKVDKILIVKKEKWKPSNTLYYFVKIRSKSPIHCGWFSQAEINGIVEIMQKKEYNLDPDMKCKARIEKVISMKTPSLCKTLPAEKQIQNVFTRFQKKGKKSDHRKSFMFLVKWNSLSYEELCWQNESIVFHYPFPLLKFLGLRLFQLSYIEKKPVPLIYFMKEILDKYCDDFSKIYEEKNRESPILHISFHPTQTSVVKEKERKQKVIEKFMKNVTEKQCREGEVHIYESDDQIFKLKDILCLILNKVYLVEPINEQIINLPQVSVILTSQSHVKLWKQKIYFHHPLLEVATMENQREAEIVLEKDFLFHDISYPKAHVLILSYEVFWKDWKNIGKWLKSLKNIFDSKQFYNIKMLILDQLTEPDVEKLAQVELPSAKKTIITVQHNNKKIQSSVRNQLKKFSFCTFFLIFNDAPTAIDPKYRKDAVLEKLELLQKTPSGKLNQWPLVQRITFQLYILSFGFNRLEEKRDIYKELCKYSPEVFKEENQVTCLSYFRLFMTLVHDWQGRKLKVLNLDNYFLFQIKRISVYKRICQLRRLKDTVFQKQNQPNSFPWEKGMKIYFGKKVVSVDHWTPLLDYILSDMVVEHGFGSWNKILKAQNWLRTQNREILAHFDNGFKKKKYGEFLLHFFQRSIEQSKFFDLDAIIEERAIYCLELMK